ncbi:MAG: hypothetical protein JWQ19_1064 [Subtercola sp.]|nr:hypothetical protein [Subtercola sp.]
MTSGPSIVFTEFATRTDPVLRGWADFRAQVLAGARTALGSADSRGGNTDARKGSADARGGNTDSRGGSADARRGSSDARGGAERKPESAARRTEVGAPGARSGIWRLVASNHREVARSLYLYESLAQAKEHVRDLQNGERAVSVRLVKGPTAGQHGWVASVGDVAIMSCGRWYSASSLCRESAQYSLEALKSARLAATSRATGSTGSTGSDGSGRSPGSSSRASVRSGAQKVPTW